MMGIVGIEGVERWINWWLCGYIAFLIHKRYIPNPEQLNQQRFKCAAQMREPLYMLTMMLLVRKKGSSVCVM